ncbi:hypothetical protein PC121_g15357 [Phytophthora cactorum]|nr:hypothetical protein PC121_g15357 [Phytophthora cactorum]
MRLVKQTPNRSRSQATWQIQLGCLYLPNNNKLRPFVQGLYGQLPPLDCEGTSLRSYFRRTWLVRFQTRVPNLDGESKEPVLEATGNAHPAQLLTAHCLV